MSRLRASNASNNSTPLRKVRVDCGYGVPSSAAWNCQWMARFVSLKNPGLSSECWPRVVVGVGRVEFRIWCQANCINTHGSHLCSVSFEVVGGGPKRQDLGGPQSGA